MGISTHNRRLFIARHGETVFNKVARMQGQAELHTPLTWEGCVQAREMGRALAEYLGADATPQLWSSTAGRALQTLALIAEEIDADWHETNRDDRLLEIDVGRWSSRTYADISAEIGPIVDARFHATFTQALGNLITNGVPLLSALRLLVRGTANQFFRSRLHQAIDSVAAGETLSLSLHRAGGFQSQLTDIISIGEQTGQLARSLQKASSRYDKELDRRIQRLTSLVSPVIIVLVILIFLLVGTFCMR
jgi:broad specificity phosphatase PhoE